MAAWMSLSTGSPPRTTCRRKDTTFARCWDRMTTQVPSFTPPLGLLNVRRAPKTCHQREAAPLWWCCHTHQASVRTSGGCAGSMEWRWSSRLNSHCAECWSRWRALCQWRRPRWCTESPPVVARVTLVRPGEAGGQAERTPRGLPERDPGEVCSSGACMEGPPHHKMGGDHNGWHSQAPQGAAAQGSHPHPNDPSWRTLHTGTQGLSSLDAGWLP